MEIYKDFVPLLLFSFFTPDRLQVQASTSTATYGPPFSLDMWIEPVGEGYARLRADGQDSALVGVLVRDAQGNALSNSNIQVSFNITGGALIYGTGNGEFLRRSSAFFEKCFFFCSTLTGQETPATTLLTSAAPSLHGTRRARGLSSTAWGD